MAKEKYVYNEQTLRYEKVKNTKRRRLFQILTILGVIGLFTLGAWLLAPGKGDNQQREAELDNLKEHYEKIAEQLSVMEKALDNLHERDAALLRQVLELDPTDEGYWNGGRGGSDKYAGLNTLSEDELIRELTNRVVKMRQRMAILIQSQDSIYTAAKEKQEKLAAIPSIRPIRKLDRKMEYLSGFGYRKHPIFKILKKHTGIDFGASTGTPIYATGNGKVIRVVYKKTGYGRHVIIDHGFGYQSLYAHMSKIEVKVGEEMKRGQIIGRVGSTGTSTAPHLHYEIIYNKKKINPMPFCRDGLSPEDYKKFVDAVSKQNLALSIH